MESFNDTYYLTVTVCDIDQNVLCALLYILLIILTAVAIGGNTLVVISILYFKQLHTATNYFIFSLALADLLIGLVIYPYHLVLSFTSCFFVQTIHCNIRSTFDFMLSVASVLNLCCIAIDRHYAVCQPLMYKSKITERVAIRMCLGSWTTSVVLGTIFAFVAFAYEICLGECFIIFLVCGGISIYVPVIVLIFIHFKILFVAQKQERLIQNNNSQMEGKKERKSTKTMSIVIGLFLLCWLPLFVASPMQHMNLITMSLMEPINWFALFNSMLNPFIYAFFYRWYRSAFRLLLSGKVFQGDYAHTKLH